MTKQFTFRHDSLKLAGCVIVAYTVLIWSYNSIIFDSNLSLILRLPQITLDEHKSDLLLGLIYVLLPLLWIKSSTRVSIVLYVYLYITVLVPSILFVTTNEQMDGTGRHLKALFCVFCFGVIYIGCVARTGTFNASRQMRRFVGGGVGIVAVFGTIYLIVSNPAAFQNVDFLNVYGARLELRTALEEGSASRFNVYLTNWMGVAIAPFLAVYGIYYKKRLYLVAALIVAFSAFAVSTHKSVFFSTSIVILFALSLQASIKLGLNKKSYHVNIAIVLVFFLILASIFIDLALQKGSIMTFYVTFRMFLNNGYLTSVYLEFFENQEMLLYADSFMSSLISSEFDQSYSRRLGDYITRYDAQNNANANFLADGYVNLGYFGMIVASLQAAFIFWIMDSFAKGRQHAMAVCIVLPAGLMFSNGPIHTALVTNGIAVSIFLLLLIPRITADRPGTKNSLYLPKVKT